ncbi:hypothetical protein [Effusibacillus consociatus]|uniref:Uncharacterized protein n=1 Tax=Effusibacillus consociatus TaxID=1117041 RepID=A0ABV9Q617_9BACL
MKFNISVDIDWLHDNSIDDEIKERIVDAVVERISEETMQSIAEKTEKIIEQKIDSLVTETYENFLEKGVTITDEWGDTVIENINILDLIKKKADKWLTQVVDKEGRPTDRNSWGERYTRLDWFIDQRLDKETKRMSDDIVKKVNDEIKKYINDSVKASIGEKLVKEIGLENIISGTKKAE